jgi:hypothetical protein
MIQHPKVADGQPRHKVSRLVRSTLMGECLGIRGFMKVGVTVGQSASSRAGRCVEQHSCTVEVFTSQHPDHSTAQKFISPQQLNENVSLMPRRI